MEEVQGATLGVDKSNVWYRGEWDLPSPLRHPLSSGIRPGGP